MNLTDEEIALVTEWQRVRSAFVKAKEGRSKNEAAYQKAKDEMSAVRTYWRGVRDAFAAGPGTATPATHAVSTGVQGASKKKGK